MDNLREIESNKAKIIDLLKKIDYSKNQIRENYSDWLIVHMMITKYKINNEFYNHLPTNVKSEYICLDINFICFSKDFIKKIENIFNKYHIQVKLFLCGKYIRNSFEEDQTNIFLMCEKIIDGHNENEIFSVPKFQKNKTRTKKVRALPCLAGELPNLADRLCLSDGFRF